MPPAVVAGGLMAVGTIGGAVLGASAQKSAINQASGAQTQMAAQNAALAREFRDANQANFQPNLNSGVRANALIDSFLYGPQSVPAVPTAPAQSASTYNGPSLLEIQAMRNDGVPGNYRQAMAQYNAAQAQPRQNALAPTAQAPTGNPIDGYQTFVNSPYYQFPLQEGMRQLNTGLASHGELNSGDAMKAAIQYGQDYGYGKMGEFLGLAGQQTDRGIQSASAIAGVGQQALASQTAANSAAGNSLANAALARGASTANMYGSIGGALGSFAGSFFPGTSSYRGF